MTTSQVILMVVVFVLVDSVVLGAVVATAGMTWAEISKGSEPVEPRPGFVRKDFQSVRIGMYSFGGSVHIAVDEDRLHLYPAAFLRSLCRAQPMSIAWERVRPMPGKPRFGQTRATINGVSFSGPTWALAMADTRPGSEPAGPPRGTNDPP